MLNLTYSINTNLLQILKDIESLNAQLLLTPISKDKELKIQWAALVDRIYFSLKLSQNPLLKQQMSKILLTEKSKQYNQFEAQIVDYKKALDIIKYDWFAITRPITVDDLVNLNHVACQGTLKPDSNDLERLLSYLQVKQENPVIQAAIAHLQMMYSSPFTVGNGRTSRLFTYLILYKYGLDFRNMINLEEYWYETPKAYEYNFKLIEGTGNANAWIEYFATGVASQLKKTLDTVNLNLNEQEVSTKWTLTERQKEILSIFDQPKMALTNKKVQQLFKISQITASRDLSRLAKLGLIRANGQGRSIYYTKF